MHSKNLIIEKPTPDDKRAMLKIIEELDQPKNIFLNDFKDMWFDSASRPTFLVAILPNGIGDRIGFIAYADARLDFGTYNLTWHMVDKNLQNAGIGKALLLQALKKLKETKGACCAQLVSKIPAYYKKFGFKTIRKTKDGSSHMVLEW